MKRFKRENQKHIQELFSARTGMPLPAQKHRVPRMALLAAVIVCFAALAGFSAKLVSGLDGDELSFSSAYLGQGIVEIRVENYSDKDITFQPVVKLMRWEGAEEVPAFGKVRFSGRTIPAGETGTMTLDLSGAYDVAELEKPLNGDWYYLVLTNNSFLFGQDWMCTVRFLESPPVETEPVVLPSASEADPTLTEKVLPELAPFFEAATTDRGILRERREAYYDACGEALASWDGNVVPSVCPPLVIDHVETVVDPSVPPDKHGWLTGLQWERSDGYGIPVGASDEEFALVLSAFGPASKEDYDGGAPVPVVYYMAWPVEETREPGACAFIHGQIVSFDVLKENTVYEDEAYVLIDVTDLFYTDLEAHTDRILLGQSYYMDDTIRERIRTITSVYRNREMVEPYVSYH